MKALPLAALLLAASASAAPVATVKAYDLAGINDGLEDGKPTVSIAFHLVETSSMTWEKTRESLDYARRAFGRAGVQLRVESARAVDLPPGDRFFPAYVLTRNPARPELSETDVYADLAQTAPALSSGALRVLSAVIPDDGGRTIHVVGGVGGTIQGWERLSPGATTWVLKDYATSAISLPAYVYGSAMPRRLRGAIMLEFFRTPKTLAHELGHKLINVSHEYRTICPAMAVKAPGGLMVYGDGDEIASGAEGRWHRERLLASPYLYTVVKGRRRYNPGYRDAGVYKDRIYGTHYVDPVCPPKT